MKTFFSTETAFRTALKHSLHKIGCWCVSNEGTGRRGVPDLIVCAGNRFVALELGLQAKDWKHPRCALQLKALADIRKAGGYALSVTPGPKTEVVLKDIERFYNESISRSV